MSIELIESRHAEAVAKLEADRARELNELQRRLDVEKTLPKGLPLVNFMHFYKDTPPRVAYTVRELGDVLRIVEAYAPMMVPYKYAKAGSSVLQPPECMKPEYAASAAAETEWCAPMLRYHAYDKAGQSAEFELWARVSGQLLHVSVRADFYQGNGSFGIWAHCRRQECCGESHVVPHSWTSPSNLKEDKVLKWGSGSPTSASWTLHWRTMEKFVGVFGEMVEARRKQREESKVRAKADYAKRRNEAEILEKCRLVLDTLARPEVMAALPVPVGGWTLAAIREAGYSTITKAVQAALPEVLKVGIHDFVNSVYFLSKDTDGYEHAEHYRDDMRAVFDRMTGARS